MDGQPEKGTAQFIIPTGIDLGRVKSGIQYWFRERVIPSLIYFPTSKEWMSDKAYQKRVSKVMAWLKRLVKDGGLNLKSEVHEIQNIDDHRQGFKYLLTKMKEMRAADPDSTIYIDTTSAPKTWLIAAMSVVPFFSRVTLYHVKSGITPNDYSEKQINDKGGETDTINLGLAENRVLTDLVRRSGSRSVLFEALCEKAKNFTTPVNTKEFIGVLKSAFPNIYAKKAEDHIHKAVTGFFGDLEKAAHLVDVTGHAGKKHVRLTEVGTEVTDALYPEHKQGK